MFICTKDGFGLLCAAEDAGLFIDDAFMDDDEESDTPLEYHATYPQSVTLPVAPHDAFEADAAELEALTKEDEEWAEISA